MASQLWSVVVSDPSLLKIIPALPPPPGVTPNFTNPEVRGPLMITICSILLGIMISFYAIRFYTKHFISRKYSWDDLTCTISVVGSIAYYGIIIWACTNGPVGKHQWDLHLDQIITKGWAITCWLSIVLVAPIMLAIKLTFFLLYLKIFYHNANLRMCIYVGALLSMAFYLGMGIAGFILFTPRHGMTWLEYNFRVPRTSILADPLAAVGLGIDIYILVLPIGGVMQLHMPTQRKIGVCIIFATGLLFVIFSQCLMCMLGPINNRYSACIASSLSIYYRVLSNQSRDRSWNSLLVELSACAEMFIGVICTCMPSFSKILHHHNTQVQKWKSLLSSVFVGLRSSWTRIRGQMKTSSSSSPSSSSSVNSGENGKTRQIKKAVSSFHHHHHHHQNHNFIPLEDVVISKITTDGARGGGDDDGSRPAEERRRRHLF